MWRWVIRSVTLIAFLVPTMVVPQTGHAQGETLKVPPRGRSAGEFVIPDGRFDLEAARLSGFEGSLDLDSLNLQFDPRTGEPRLRPSASASPSDDPDDIYWDNGIAPCFPGVYGQVYATTVFDGRLVVGGEFTIAGCVIANNIASWDGSSWSPLGSGMNSAVRALTVYDGKLIAGGDFTLAGGDTASYIASWDGGSWTPLGSGMNSVVRALTAYDGKLIAGGDFTTAGGAGVGRIASWDGGSWTPLGSGMNSVVRALTEYDGKLIVGGDFWKAGGDTARYIACWDGSSWLPLGSGMNGKVQALTVYNGRLIAGGDFTTAGGTSANKTASWDGTAWSALGSGVWESGYPYTPTVLAMNVYNGILIAGGDFTTAGGTSANYIASWDGVAWSALESGLNYHVFNLTVYDGNLIVGGSFSTAGGIPARYIASWDENRWSPLVLGTGEGTYDIFIYSLTAYDGKLIAGGNFTSAGGVTANCIASWDGSSWSPLGSGMGGIYPRVNALTVYDGKLIAGGQFTTAGGVEANFIASWDGFFWSPLGLGMGGGRFTPLVNALTVYDGKLIVGGDFTTAGGVAANYIASWDGSSWSPLGSGMGGLISENHDVHGMTVYDGKLIAGGDFRSAGGVAANGIASWDGNSWSALASGVNGNPISALTVFDGKLIAGGWFSTAGGVSANYIASWDGSSWSPLGSGMGGLYGWVHALTAYDGRLFAGGDFRTAGGVEASRIASWDGISWSALGSGVGGAAFMGEETYGPAVYALTAHDGKLVAGGEFWTAGNKVSACLAAWTKGVTDVEGHNGENLPEAFSLVQNYPNPFNPTTSIAYDVPQRSQVLIEVFNILGQHVRTLVEETKSAGSYRTEWNAKDDAGRPAATGVYLYRLTAGEYVETKKMVLLK